MDKKRLYQKAYRLLEETTPLKFDCGELCGSACCKGDEDKGMLVFPGEEQLFAGIWDDIKIKQTSITLEQDKMAKLAVCRGKCQRHFRPLSCRIFPLTPYFPTEGKLQIIMDPRAKSLCPIAANTDHAKINRIFARRVRHVFQQLVQDAQINHFIQKLSRILDEYQRFY